VQTSIAGRGADTVGRTTRIVKVESGDVGEETAQACVNAIYRELIEKSALQSRSCRSTKRLLISILFILLAENL